MRAWIAAALAVGGLLAVPATASAACGNIPAGFADDLPVRDRLHAVGTREERSTSLCVRAGDRRIVLRRAYLEDPYEGRPRGTVIGGAAAAGRTVAWIETRFPRGRRVSVVRVMRVGARGRVRPLRRLVVGRDHSDRTSSADVLVTARGELAWLAPRDDFRNRIVYDPPRGRPRTVAITAAESLWLEDRITLAWYGDAGYGFHDLRRPAGGGCPRRSAFREIAANDTVVVTEGAYADGERQVLRACVRATGRDRVIAQADNGFGNGNAVYVAGLDRHWVLIERSYFTRYDSCAEYGQRPVDARTGRRGRATGAPWCTDDSTLAGTDQQLAVTDRCIAAWTVADGDALRLLAAAPGGGVTELDRGAIAGLGARGTSVDWTNTGAPRSMELP